jgi:major membrane immunogen (membrane-anchored lipoprotein)
MKTLEQVIKDACAKHLSSYSLFDAEYIANDIREWQKELHKDKKALRVEIEEALINSHVAGFSDKELEIMSEECRQGIEVEEY